ncbi:Eukaryotic aspartyl protease family protein [Striga hermonthica]|uniref:Eukaryotic aspartyl protease family protein n=1 Tax=Striga hermonthica TaxID=68872 RepID=A0A9N7MMP5_STRHE|nr:Eukaryotic aspartyl protease family protein [Striga hermonthica]
MGSTKPVLLITLAALLLISLVPMSQCRKRQAHGFTTNLIHRDSSESPYYDPTLSPEQRLMYGDGSYTEGDLSTDTVTLASSGGTAVSVPGVVVGCGHRNAGIFSGVESGIVGLGGGKASLVGQLGRLAGGRFSYCLASENSRSSSRLSFGADAEVRGPRAVQTPLVRQGIDTFYYLTMLGISVGSRRLAFNEGSSSSNGGNIIIDSGTTVTLLPGSLYEGLKKTLQGMVRLRQIPDPTGTLDLCFETRGSKVGLPEVTVHFKGADVKWGQENLFARTGDVSLCLVALPAQGFPIYGNRAQTNFLVGYNLRKGMLSFKPVRCGGKP